MRGLATLDLTFAKARYAEELDANLPELLPMKPRKEPPTRELRSNYLAPGIRCWTRLAWCLSTSSCSRRTIPW